MSAPETVLVTRPVGQETGMMRLLAETGYVARHCPALAIRPLPLEENQQRLLMELDQYHAVFFASANAVLLGLEAMRDYWPQWPVGVHWLAVGDATAAALEKAGLRAESPENGFNSEAVLSLSCLADLRERRILVLRGEGGRALLGETLAQRGARVDYLELYRRICAIPMSWPDEPLAAVLVTSVESWQCLQQHAGERLRGVLIVAGSERIARAVRKDGYERVCHAASPRDEDMLECLKTNLPLR